MTTTEHWRPTGFKFKNDGEEYILCDGGNREGLKGWLCYRRPDGQWVTLRECGREEREAIWIIADAFHPEEDNSWILKL